MAGIFTQDVTDRARAALGAAGNWLSDLLPRRPTPIAIMSFNRPDYLSQVVDSLSAQADGLGRREIHFFQDGAVNAYSGVRYAADEEIAACLAVREEKLPQSVLHLSPQNIGICENFLRAEKFLFEERKFRVAYFFEDDMELSPWYLRAMDMLEKTVRHEPKIGYFAAYGDHAMRLEDQRQRRRRLAGLNQHWAFGLKRSTWLAMQPVLAPYYDLVVGSDYRQRPDQAIWAAQGQFGLRHPATSQDGAKGLAAAVIGVWRARSVACYGRYIGKVGVNFSEPLYRQRGYAETVMMPDAPEGFDLPDPAKLDEAIAGTRDRYRQEHEKKFPPPVGSAATG